MRVERARPVPWSGAGRRGGEKPLMQPERWTFNFGGPNHVVQVEYWAGNKSASVRTTSNGFIATLTNLHKGVGMPIPWILLIDTLAGSLIFLSLSGVILWWETNRRRRLGIAIFGVVRRHDGRPRAMADAAMMPPSEIRAPSRPTLRRPIGSRCRAAPSAACWRR